MGGRARLEQLVASVPVWYHAIELPDGVITPGTRGWTMDSLQLPDLTGKTVLDIGAWDGYFSFEAERRGASRVVALDHYVWSLDLEGWHRHQAERAADGLPPLPAHEIPDLWRPDELPGKRGFEIAREALGSEVEDVVGNFMEMDLAELGEFDVVLYLGVLYHMEDPLAAMRRLRSVARELAVIETEAMSFPGEGERRLFEFLPGAELAGDPSNWWVPNREGALGLCRAAGFAEANVAGAIGHRPPEQDGLSRFRALVHARRG